MKRFNTVLEESVAELVIQKSRFITYLIPVQSETAAAAHLERIRKLHWDATHHVPAWILGHGVQKFSDDGEPGGTAGLPVLESLKHSEMQDCMLVVVRYFGGVKLGTGGLVRAYGQAARDALTAAKRYTVREFNHLQIQMDYTQIGRVQAYLSQAEALGIDTVFTDAVKLTFYVELDRTDEIRDKLIDLTHGAAEVTLIGTELLAVRENTYTLYDKETFDEKAD